MNNRDMNKRFGLMLPILLSLIFIFTGCATMGKPVPSANIEREKAFQAAVQQKNYPITVAVIPFGEKRGNYNNYGSVYRYLIPLMPYGTIQYERPEDAKMFNTVNAYKFDLAKGLSEVFFKELKDANIFDNVMLVSGQQSANADFVITGDIVSTLYEGKTYSYGISFLGPALWCFGLPAGSSYNKLDINLFLKNNKSGDLIWSYAFDKEKTVIQGLYYNWGTDLNSYTNLMQEGMKEVIRDLRQKLSKYSQEQLKNISNAAALQEQAKEQVQTQNQAESQPQTQPQANPQAQAESKPQAQPQSSPIEQPPQQGVPQQKQG